MDLKGSQKIAVLLLALGDKFTADVFKRMDRQEITAISKAIVDLPPVPREEVEAVLREFHQSLVTGMDVVSGGEDAAKRLLMANLDGETAKYVMDSLELETGPVPFRELERVSPRMLAQLLRSEHPQTLALILGHLKPDQAATMLSMLPAGVRAEVLMRLAKLESVPEDMLMEVDRVLQSQLIAMGGKEGKKVGGVQSVARIFALIEVLCASDELKERFFKNMSERAGNMIREELEYMGPARLSEVEGAQQNIVKIVRRLEGANKIVINRGGGGDAFI